MLSEHANWRAFPVSFNAWVAVTVCCLIWSSVTLQQSGVNLSLRRPGGAGLILLGTFALAAGAVSNFFGLWFGRFHDDQIILTHVCAVAVLWGSFELDDGFVLADSASNEPFLVMVMGF